MRCRFQHRLGDIIELNRYACEQRIKSWIVAATGLTFALICVWFWLDRGEYPSPLLLFAAFCLGLSFFATRLAGIGAWIWVPKIVAELEINEMGIDYVHSNGPQIAWREVGRWFMTPNLMAIHLPTGMLAIPRRCVSEIEWKELVEIVRRALGEPAKW